MENKRKRREGSGVETTPDPSQIVSRDLEVLVTPKNQQKDKKRKKQKNVEIIPAPSKIEPDYPEDLVKPPMKKLKKQKKIIDELSNRLNEMTEIVKKLEKNSDQLEISLKEKETPKKKVIEYECCFESKDAFTRNRRSIFVKGFDCSFPKDEIRSTLIEHFSSCGHVTSVFIPFHCKTGSPLGFAFINLANLKANADKALTLNRSYLGGMLLTVTMAIDRDEYCGFTNHRGCERCCNALMKHRTKLFYQRSPIYFSPEEIKAVLAMKKQ